jgi:two-component system NtrC family sensor kinase
MLLKFRTRQLLAFALVVGVIGISNIWAGYTFLNKTILNEAQLRVEKDLNGVWAAYREALGELRYAVSTSTHGTLSARLISARTDRDSVTEELNAVCEKNGLDFLTLIGADRKVIAQANYSKPYSDEIRSDPIIEKALAGEAAYGTIIMTPAALRAEGEELLQRAFIPLVHTEMAVSTEKIIEDRGLVMEAAIPLFDETGVVRSVLYGGNLLNRKFALVDDIRRAVFGEMTYNNKPVGTVTIFLWDVRISTNVIQMDQTRALGTRVSERVYRQVLEEGKRFVDRAFVVNDWYLSAYDPIKDPTGKVIGIAYVGLLEKKYLAYSSALVGRFLLISVATLVIAVLMAIYSTRTFRLPLQQLVNATRELSSGNLAVRVHVRKASRETVELAAAFDAMAESLERRNMELSRASKQLQLAYQQTEDKNRAYLETLSFVTHELKSPLASIVLAIGAVRENILGPLTPEQEAALKSASSSADYLQMTIANYLNLSRVEEGRLRLEPVESDLGKDIAPAVIERLGEMASDKQMVIINGMGPDCRAECDPGLITSVFQNLLTNAIIYGREGGKIELRCAHDDDTLTIEVWNEGKGFSPEIGEKLFGKFFRVSDEGQNTRAGTGVGLFVSRRIIEAHGGRIWAHSCKGEWACFSFILPREAISPQDQGVSNK